MRELENLYSDTNTSSEEFCNGCSILGQYKPVYSQTDYKTLPEKEILFLSDSFKYRQGNLRAFSKQEMKVIEGAVPNLDLCAFSASIKCPGVKEKDMSPNNMNLCRQHLEATVDKVKPKLVFVCGNLAMKMLIKKSGITSKRGSSYEYSTEAGHSCIVVPIYHPFACIQEPRHLYLFEVDVKNAYEKYVLEKANDSNFTYSVLMEIEEVQELAEKLRDSSETFAADLETTGLNFLTDSIMTVAISTRDKTWVIPVDHKDSPHKGNLILYSSLRRIFENPKSRKVFHNAKFDVKFLINYGIYPKNVWDTKIMHHFVDENMPKSLMDLVKLYFSNELENL